MVFGAFLHDIGKLYERAETLSRHAEDERKQQEYCPSRKNHYSHRHALHTLAFCEKLEKSCLILEQILKSDENWRNIASRHHKPSGVLEHIVSKANHLAGGERGEESVYEQRQPQKKLLEPLLEKVSLIGAEKKTQHYLPLRPLDKTCADLFPKKHDEFFPEKPSGKMLGKPSGKMPEKLPGNLPGKLPGKSPGNFPGKLTEEYKALADGLLEAIEGGLPEHKEANFESLRSTLLTLLSQFERFLIHVPSAANAADSDIPLFDHLRITAAIAEGLYLYHEHDNSLEESAVNRASDEKKWTLACGDFSGIQKFIYNVVSKNAAKGLAGRSLFIQLFCDAASEWILREMKLYPTSRIYSSGGKFYLLIASHLKEKLREKINQINQVLLDEYQGRIHLGLGTADLSERDFWPDSMSEKFKEAGESLREDREKKFLPLIRKSPKDFFQTRKVSAKVCRICGSDSPDLNNLSSKKPDDEITCGQCETFKNLGEKVREIMNPQASSSAKSHKNLGEKVREIMNPQAPSSAKSQSPGLLWVWSHEDDRAIKPLLNDPKSRFDIFSHKRGSVPDSSPFCKLYAVNKNGILEDLKKQNICLKNSHFEFVNSIEDLKTKSLSFGHRFIASCAELKLEAMAKKTKGIERIGVLRMDVDNLGRIFIDGLKREKSEKPEAPAQEKPNPLNQAQSGQELDQTERPEQGAEKTAPEEESKKLGHLSRKAALSRQINAFFTGCLPRWAEKNFEDNKIIYAGGDDLLALGPWDQLPEMAFQIRQEFKKYCCGNPDLTLSAGVSVFPKKYPLLAGSHAAGEAEEKAKSFNRGLFPGLPSKAKKNALCFLGTAIGWEEYPSIRKFKSLVERIIKKTKSQSLLQVLLHIDGEIHGSGAERERLKNSWDDLMYKPWRYRFVYHISKLLERHRKDENLRKDIYELKDWVLLDNKGNNKLQGEASVEPDDLGKSGAREKSARPAFLWLRLPVRWADYLLRENKGKPDEEESKKTG